MISRISFCFPQSWWRKKETEVSVFSFSTAYFLMKEYLPNRKFLPFKVIPTKVKNESSKTTPTDPSSPP